MEVKENERENKKDEVERKNKKINF